MSDLAALNYQELVDLAKSQGIETHKVSKAKLIEALTPTANEEVVQPVEEVSPSVDPVSDAPQHPDLDAYYVGDRWVYVPKGDPPPPAPEYRQRLFDQKGVLYTSEDRSALTKAYNLENSIAINDVQLELGAKQRGQKVGDASRGRVNRDKPAEGGY